MVTPGTAAQGSGGDGSARAQHRHNQTGPSGNEANAPVPCHLALLNQYCMLRGKDTEPLGHHRGGSGISSCPSPTFSLDPGFMGWIEKWMALTFPRSVRSLVKVPSYRESSSQSRMPGPLKGSKRTEEREVGQKTRMGGH